MSDNQKYEPLCQNCVDLVRLIRELEEALLPLAELNDVCLQKYREDQVVWALNSSEITAVDIRRACKLLGLEEFPERKY